MACVRPTLGCLPAVLGTHRGPDAGQELLGELNARFDCQAIVYGPYFFADLAPTATGDADEQAAIDNGLIQANRIQYRRPAQKAIRQHLPRKRRIPRMPPAH